MFEKIRFRAARNVRLLKLKQPNQMHRLIKNFLFGAALTFGVTGAALPLPPADAHGISPEPAITVYKDPNCGCCAKWVDHLVKHGFRVTAKDSEDMTAVKAGLGVPPALNSCHTGLVNGYIIEGHVPAADIKRLLVEKPKVAGLAVPGMPMGSPGMEGPRTDRYDVLTFDKAGKTTVFASH